MEEGSNTDNNKLNNYFKTKVRSLEVENKGLKDELILLRGNNDVNIIEYYLRLRTDLLSEIETLKETKESNELNYKNENDLLKAEVSQLKHELSVLMNQKNKVATNNNSSNNNNNIINHKIIDNTLSQRPNIISDRDSVIVANVPTNMNTLSMTDINTNTNANYINSIHTNNNEYPEHTTDFNINSARSHQMQFHPNQMFSLDNYNNNISSSQFFRGSSIKREFDPSNNISTEIEYLGNSNDKEKVSELEDKVMELETKLSEKDFLIKDQNDKITELHNLLHSTNEHTKNEIATWKTKYNSIISSNKTINDQYQCQFDDKIKSYKTTMETTKYELEKKIMHLETVLDHKEKDFNVQIELNRDNLLEKEHAILELKNTLQSLQSNYSLMYSHYNEHLLKLITNLNNMRNLYFTREQEFVNITKYYLDMVNEYSQPLHDNATPKHKIEAQFVSQSKDIVKLQRQIETAASEITALTNENNDAVPKMRMKLTKTIQDYDTKLNGIVSTHGDIKTKLEVLFDFTKTMEDKLNKFNSVMEDNKKLIDKINLLECQCKMNDPQSKNNQILFLREKICRLEKETQVKTALIKDYDELFKNADTKTLNSKSLTNDEVIIKLKSEITVLNSHINNLHKCKDNIEKFYQLELKNLIDKITCVNTANDELLGTIRKMENDFQGKKETTLNQWMLEFKEFKDNLLRIENIQSIITSFNVDGDGLTKHKEYICNEELFQLRQEIKGKDDALEQLKLSHDKENKRNERIIENYKKTTDKRMEMYDELIESRNKGINAVRNEKQKLLEFYLKKKNLLESEKKCWKEQTEEINAIIKDQGKLKDKQIEMFQKETEELEHEIHCAKENKDVQLDTIIQQMNVQMKLIKDREEFTVNQLDLLQKQFDMYKDEKERVIKVLKMENEQLKNFNNLLNKRNNNQN